MVNDWYGLVKKKSNHSGAEMPAKNAASRRPGMTTTTTTATITSASAVLVMCERRGTRMAAAAGGKATTNSKAILPAPLGDALVPRLPLCGKHRPSKSTAQRSLARPSFNWSTIM
jgi:hypothetical protein